MNSPAPTLGRPGPRLDPRDALAQAIRTEARLIRQLTTIMVTHRNAMLEGDPEEVEIAVFKARRVLGTLTQARLRRERLMARAMGSSDWSLDELADVPGAASNEDLRTACADLRSVMLDLDDVLAVNRRTLQMED